MGIEGGGLREEERAGEVRKRSFFLLGRLFAQWMIVCCVFLSPLGLCVNVRCVMLNRG